MSGEKERSSPSRTATNTLSRLVAALLELPSRLAAILLLKILAILRPITPQLVPLIICLLFVPLLALLAVTAGWIVWRTTAVNWAVDVFLQYGDGIPPYALVDLPRLVPQQPYDISLHLVLPACDSNFALGNFMTSLTISTHTNDTLVTVRRPTIALPPQTKSWSILSGQPSVVEFDVALLDSYVPGTSNLLAYIQLGRQDGWRSIGHGEGREISVFSAFLRGTVKHRGIRGLVTRFPLLAPLVSAVAFFSVTCIVFAVTFLPMIVRRPKDEVETPSTPATPPTRLELVESRQVFGTAGDEDVKPPRRGRSRRGSRSAVETPIFKTEVPMPTTPTGPSRTTPVRRRRRSRASDGEA